MREDLLLLSLVIVGIAAAAWHVELLERRATRYLDPHDGAPDVSDHPIFAAAAQSAQVQVVEPARALAAVLAQGDLIRRCLACQSQKTDFETLRYRRLETGWSVPVVRVTCLECDNVDEGWIKPVDHAAAYALEAWNTSQLAQAAFEAGDEGTMDEDLRELDR